MIGKESMILHKPSEEFTERIVNFLLSNKYGKFSSHKDGSMLLSKTLSNKQVNSLNLLGDKNNNGSLFFIIYVHEWSAKHNSDFTFRGVEVEVTWPSESEIFMIKTSFSDADKFCDQVSLERFEQKMLSALAVLQK